MAYAVIVEVPGGTLEGYDAIGAAMGFQGDGEKSTGLLVHFAGIDSSVLIVVDVWESREAYQRHLAALGEKGREGVRKAGLPAYAHREFELHNIVK